jgi:hypothetical protein
MKLAIDHRRARVFRNAGFVIINHTCEQIHGTRADEFRALIEVRGAGSWRNAEPNDFERELDPATAQSRQGVSNGARCLGENHVGLMLLDPVSDERGFLGRHHFIG